jgi:2-oxoglutarate dehydrogenase complex dehydrogenase (E1) component-like enzyme
MSIGTDIDWATAEALAIGSLLYQGTATASLFTSLS